MDDWVASQLAYFQYNGGRAKQDSFKAGTEFANALHRMSGKQYTKDGIIHLAESIRLSQRYEYIAYRLGLVSQYIYISKKEGGMPQTVELTPEDMRIMGLTVPKHVLARQKETE